MTRPDVDRTPAIRAWLAAGSEEISPRVLEGVLREVPAMSQDRPHWAGPRFGMSSFALGAAVGGAAVTLVVAVIGSGLVGGMRPGGTGETPSPTPVGPSATPGVVDYSYRDMGFNGLAPQGATPSDPARTDLVEVFARPGPPYLGAAFLYADGRLIWNEYFGDVEGAFHDSTGWLEQSLTAEGIELVRALAVDGWMLNGRRSPRVLKPEELPDLLPARAWADMAIRPYVPSGYAACLSVMEQENPFLESGMSARDMLAALPRAAADVLRDRPPVVDSSRSYGDDPRACLGMDVRDARRVDAALRAAGFEQERWNGPIRGVLDRPEAGTWWLNVFLEPILPDGTITCSGCG
jgi:hypothetical protein